VTLVSGTASVTIKLTLGVPVRVVLQDQLGLLGSVNTGIAGIAPAPAEVVTADAVGTKRPLPFSRRGVSTVEYFDVVPASVHLSINAPQVQLSDLSGRPVPPGTQLSVPATPAQGVINKVVPFVTPPNWERILTLKVVSRSKRPRITMIGERWQRIGQCKFDH
jgi:hypothetical protein